MESKMWMLSRIVRFVAGGLVTLVFAWFFLGYPRGMLAAWIDQARGRSEIQLVGLPNPWDRDVMRLCEERHNIKLRRVAGCIVSDNMVKYVNGYNLVSTNVIQTRFGRDVVAECYAEAERQWKLANPNR